MYLTSIRQEWVKSVGDLRDTRRDPRAPNLQQVMMTDYFSSAAQHAIDVMDKTFIANAIDADRGVIRLFSNAHYADRKIRLDIFDEWTRDLLVLLRNELFSLSYGLKNKLGVKLQVDLFCQFEEQNIDLHSHSSTVATIALTSPFESGDLEGLAQDCGTVFVGAQEQEVGKIYATNRRQGNNYQLTDFFKLHPERTFDVHCSPSKCLNVFNGSDSANGPVYHAAPQTGRPFQKPRLLAVFS